MSDQKPAEDLATRRQTALEQIEIRMLESFLWDGFGGSDLYYDVMRQRFGDESSGYWVPPSVIGDRKDGASWPIFRNEIDLARYRQQSRVCAQKNAYAISTLGNLVNYIIGKGFTYKVQPKEDRDTSPEPGMQPDDTAKQMVAAGQKIIDDLLQANRWTATVNPTPNQVLIAQSKERESCVRVFRDGETILRLFFLEDGRTAIRFVEPEQVTQPPSRTAGDGWSFGMRHATEPFDDEETIEEYYVKYKDPTGKDDQGEYVPAAEIVHIKPSLQDATIKRGLPAFILDTFDAFERASKLQRNVSQSSAFRAATAEIWKHTGGTSSDIANFAARTNPTGYPNNPDRPREKLPPGAVRRVAAGMEPIWPQAVGASEHLEVAQGDLRQGVSAFNAPEHFTGDASNANYASTKEAGTPFVLSAEVLQEHFKTAFCVVLLRAIAWAIECGTLPGDFLDVCELQVETPAIAVRDPLAKAQEDQILIGTKIKSVQTAQMERGLDPDHEGQNIEEFQARFAPEGNPLDSVMGDLPAANGPRLPAMPGPSMESVETPAPADPTESREELIADILGGWGGEKALAMLRGGDIQESVELLEAGFTGTLTDRLGRKYTYVDGHRVKGQGGSSALPAPAAASPSSAPAEPAAKKATPRAQAQAKAKARIGEIVKGNVTPEAHAELMTHLSKLTIPQLKALRDEHGFKASGRLKADLVKSIGENFRQKMVATGSVDVEALQNKLKPFEDVEIPSDKVKFAKARYEAAKQQYGTLTVHHLEEQAAEHLGALEDLPRGAKADREHHQQELALTSWMVSKALKDGINGQIEDPSLKDFNANMDRIGIGEKLKATPWSAFLLKSVRERFNIDKDRNDEQIFNDLKGGKFKGPRLDEALAALRTDYGTVTQDQLFGKVLPKLGSRRDKISDKVAA